MYNNSSMKILNIIPHTLKTTAIQKRSRLSLSARSSSNLISSFSIVWKSWLKLDEISVLYIKKLLKSHLILTCYLFHLSISPIYLIPSWHMWCFLSCCIVGTNWPTIHTIIINCPFDSIPAFYWSQSISLKSMDKDRVHKDEIGSEFFLTLLL